MDEDRSLISKRELLTRYGISYGALYRWKRKGLIPDDWFIRKSTATGQETFFPESLICERVERILETKNEVLLDELAGTFSGEDRQNAFLIIDTPYGEKSFKMNDIRSVSLSGPDGHKKDITEQVKQLLQQGRNTL
ncbi:MAG: DUF4004 family protein [Lachnospiraceae bacterium]|nr:DUF4004 family protein [Lachnospiraceae bacterium]